MAEFQTFDLGRAYSQAQNIKESQQIGELRGLQIESARRQLNTPPRLSFDDMFDNQRTLYASASSVAEDPSDANASAQFDTLVQRGVLNPSAKQQFMALPPEQRRQAAAGIAKQAGTSLSKLDPKTYGNNPDERRSALMQLWIEIGGDQNDHAGFKAFMGEQQAQEASNRGDYFQTLPSGGGYVQVNTRKRGDVSRLALDGQPVIPAPYDVPLQGAIAESTEGGKLDAQRAQQIETKVKNTQSSDELIKLAGPLVRAATGSGLGKATDAVVGFFGFSPDSADAVAALQGIAAQLTLMVPRMEGPQGVLDLQLYEKAAGDIGNASTPTSQKLAALRTISQLNAKYRELNPQGTAPNAARTVVRTGTANGRKVVQYSDGTTEYAD